MRQRLDARCSAKYFVLPAMIVIALAVSRCGSGTSTVIGPTGLRCGVSLAPVAAIVATGGGAGTLSVITDRECQWSAALSSDWLRITSAASGQGPGTIAYMAAANRSPSPRSTNLSVGEQVVQISQQGASCTLSVAPATIPMPAAGGEAKISITTGEACAWKVDANSDWVVLDSTSGTGSTDLKILIPANQGAQRSGTVLIGGQIVTVTQAAAAASSPTACSFALSPLSFTDVASDGSPLSVTVSTQPGCTWTSTTATPWLTLTAGTSTTGSGVAQLSVAANGGARRTGSATIAGRTVTVSQLAPPIATLPCVSSLSQDSFSAPALGGTAQVDVSTGGGCSWTATGNPAWISVNPGGGTGNGTTFLTALPNLGGARNATLSIAGSKFSVEQAASGPTPPTPDPKDCSYSVSPTSISAPVLGLLVPATVTISNPSNCTSGWSVGATPLWIVALPLGNTVSVTVLPNLTGSARSEGVVIAGQTVTVTQAGN